MLSKKKIEESKAELLNKQREKEDLEEKHKIEKKLYMQRIKFLMLKQQDENVELQKDAEIALKQLEDSHRIKEKDFKYDIRSLSKIKKEQEVLQSDFINALDKENVKLIHQMKNEFELKEYQLRRFYREKMKEMINNAEEKRRKVIADITDKKTKEIKKITDEHASIFNNMKNYYSELNKKNINALKNLAQLFSTELQNQGNLKSRKLFRYSQLNKINDPYNRLLQENVSLKKDEEKCFENFGRLKDQNEEYGSK
jgi:protein-tyrosine-phosphatase